MQKYILLALVLLGAVLILFHEDIGRRLGVNSTRSTESALAVVEQIKGRVLIKPAEKVESLDAEDGDPLSMNDMLIVEKDSSVVIRFPNDLTVRARAETQAVLERNDGPVVVTVLTGDVEILTSDAKNAGQVLISKGGVVRDSAGRNLPAEDGKLPQPTGGTAAVLKEIGKPGKQTPTPAAAASTEETSSDSLSDEYISSVIRSQRGFLRDRCYAALLKSKPQMTKTGSPLQVFTSFTIQPSGDITHLRVLKSSANDKDFEKCVISVLERARFKAFKNDAIIVNYPLLFE